MGVKTYWQRMKGKSVESPPMISSRSMLWSWLGAFSGIVLVGLTHRWLVLSDFDAVLLIGSFGASAVLIYGAPHLPLSQPRNLIGGHLVSALSGVFFAQMFVSLPVEFTAALAVATAIFSCI